MYIKKNPSFLDVLLALANNPQIIKRYIMYPFTFQDNYISETEAQSI